MEKKTIAEINQNKEFAKRSVKGKFLKPYAFFVSKLEFDSLRQLYRLLRIVDYNPEVLRAKAIQMDKMRINYPELTENQLVQKIFEGTKYRKPRKKFDFPKKRTKNFKNSNKPKI